MMIELNSVNKYYNKNRGNQIHVIDNTTLSLPDAGLVALFGKSGSGKTTLLNVIGGLDDYAGGSVRFGGEKLTRKNADRLRNEYVGYIFQNYNLDNEISVYKNVANAVRLMGEKEENNIRIRTEKALESVGMIAYARRLPTALSGGQQQRVAIARALAKSPRVILADEPTGNLDMANTIMIMDILKELSKDRLILLVTHEEDLVRGYCDLVVRLADGKVESTEENTAAEGGGEYENVVYLGDLPHTRLNEGGVRLDVYGDAESIGAELRLVAAKGAIYLQCVGGNVKILESKSDVRFAEGKREERKREQRTTELGELPALPAAARGKLFGARDSFLTGMRINFTSARAGRRIVIAVLVLISALLVFVTAAFGVNIAKINQLEEEYIKNVLTVSVHSQADMERVAALAQRQDVLAIDRWNNPYYYNRFYGPQSVSAESATFQSVNYAAAYDISADFAPLSMLTGVSAAAGTTEIRGDEVVITTAMADRILAQSKLPFVRSYRDVLQMKVRSGGYAYPVCGIVEGTEARIFRDGFTDTAELFSRTYGIIYDQALDELPAGNIILNRMAFMQSNEDFLARYAPGSTVTFFGRNFTVYKVLGPDGTDFDPDDYPGIDGTFGGWYGGPSSWMRMSKEDLQGLAMTYIDIEQLRAEENLAFESYIGLSETSMRVFCTDSDAVAAQLSGMDFIRSEAYRGYLFDQIKANLIVWSIVLVASLLVAAILLYYVMRSALLSRVREIGIYRALGATKRNVVFKFFMEITALAIFTVLLAFVVASALIAYIAGTIQGVFYYPVWLALVTLVFLYGMTLVMGLTPVWALLRKSPAEILAKYDI